MSDFVVKIIMMMIIIILAQRGGYSQECSLSRVLSIAPFGTRPLFERVRCQCLPRVLSSISNERFARLRYMAVFAWFLHNYSLAESDAWPSGLMDVLALLTVQNRAVDRSEEAQSLRDMKNVGTSFGVSSQCYNERRQLCERGTSYRHRVLAGLTPRQGWLAGTLRAARQRGDDASLLIRRADQSFGGRSCSAPAWLSRSRARACLSRTRVASCMHRGSITSSHWLQRSTGVEKEAQLQKEPQQLEHEFASVFEHACAQGCSAHWFGRRTGASGAGQIHAAHAHTRNLLEGLTCMVQHVQRAASVPAETDADVEAMDHDSQRSASAASQIHIRLLASCVGVAA